MVSHKTLLKRILLLTVSAALGYFAASIDNFIDSKKSSEIKKTNEYIDNDEYIDEDGIPLPRDYFDEHLSARMNMAHEIIKRNPPQSGCVIDVGFYMTGNLSFLTHYSNGTTISFDDARCSLENYLHNLPNAEKEGLLAISHQTSPYTYYEYLFVKDIL